VNDKPHLQRRYGIWTVMTRPGPSNQESVARAMEWARARNQPAKLDLRYNERRHG
jgi:hypothetical protein